MIFPPFSAVLWQLNHSSFQFCSSNLRIDLIGYSKYFGSLPELSSRSDFSVKLTSSPDLECKVSNHYYFNFWQNMHNRNLWILHNFVMELREFIIVLKQCLYDLHLTQFGDTFTKPFKLISADISWKVWWKYHFFESTKDCANTVLKTNGLSSICMSFLENLTFKDWIKVFSKYLMLRIIQYFVQAL